MPRLSVWFIRFSLLYLFAGFTFGGLLLHTKGLPWYPALWGLLPAHIEFVLFGWTVQLIMGMTFWILPRFSSPPVRGNETLVWSAFVLLNAGILLIASISFLPENQWLPLAGRVMEFAAVVAFALHAWPRVKSLGS